MVRARSSSGSQLHGFNVFSELNTSFDAGAAASCRALVTFLKPRYHMLRMATMAASEAKSAMSAVK